MRNKHLPKHLFAVFIGIAMGLVANSPVRASTLSLTQTFPDLELASLPISYSFNTKTGTGTFTAAAPYGLLPITTTGGVIYSSPTGGSTDYYDYKLSAALDGSGAFVSGSFSIADHMTGTSMLSATLTNFGATHKTGGEVFDFTGNQVSGELAQQFPAFQSGLGIIMNTADSGSTFTGSFTDGFTAAALTDHFPHPVPVPAAVWLFGSGLVGLVAVCRRGQRSR